MAPKGEKLAYINNREAELLKRMGGAGKNINETGIESYLAVCMRSGQSCMAGTAFQDTSHLSRQEMMAEVTSYQLKLDQSKKDTGARGFLDTTTTALNLIGKGIFNISGAGSSC
jgi:hypothetical protein